MAINNRTITTYVLNAARPTWHGRIPTTRTRSCPLFPPPSTCRSGGRHAPPPPRYRTSGDLTSLLPPAPSISHPTLRFAVVHLSSQTFRHNTRFYTDFKYKNCLKLLKPSTSYPQRVGLEGQGDRPVQGQLPGSSKFKLKEMPRDVGGRFGIDEEAQKVEDGAAVTRLFRQR
ncbi:hypothetical protein ONZ45_g12247 [Pleurotus djamor]|nr:hypothetical protein ONZ45_g12247 [Pleurotus djamor]